MTCTKSGDVFVLQVNNVIQHLQAPLSSDPSDSATSSKLGSAAFTCIASFRGNGLALGSEEGSIYFYKYQPDVKKFEFIRSWSCLETRQTRIISISTHEVSKDDIQMAVLAHSQNIIFFNVHKQFYM